MINKTYIADGKVSLAFLKSAAVKAFPSGRRRSTEIDKDGVDSTEAKYYIPFDPEARLNTEANSRKHSSLNGYTQTYLKEWDIGSDAEGAVKNGRILLSLAGYLFDIDLSTIKTPAAFGAEVANRLNSEYTTIYANIMLEDVHLYSSASGLPEYYTSVLRDQINAERADSDSATYSPSLSLDLLNIAISDTRATHSYVSTPDNYYFSGLSFSVEPLTPLSDGETFNISKNSNRTVSRIIGKDAEGDGIEVTVTQQLISLRILEKVDSVDAEGNIIYEADGETPKKEWKVYQPAYLPKIEHGITDDSIVVYGDTTLKGTDKHFKAEGTAEVNGDTLLKSNLTVKGTTEVDGNTTIHSNLSVDDNINVGSPVTPVTEDNGGYIVAQKNITAEQDLIAKNDLSVTNNATIKNNLIVGDPEDTTKTGNLTVKNHIETPTIEATTSVTTPQATIEHTDIVDADIQMAEISGTASVNNTITNTLYVNTKADIADATIRKAEITNANIKELSGTSAVIETVKSNDLQQKVTNLDVIQNNSYCDVPVIFINGPIAGEFQLQLHRVNRPTHVHGAAKGDFFSALKMFPELLGEIMPDVLLISFKSGDKIHTKQISDSKIILAYTTKDNVSTILMTYDIFEGTGETDYANSLFVFSEIQEVSSVSSAYDFIIQNTIEYFVKS